MLFRSANGGLSDADIERMVKEAEANKAADEKKKQLVEAKNQGEAILHSTEKALSEHGDKVGAAEKGAIETGITELKTALEGEDVEMYVPTKPGLFSRLFGRRAA